MKMFRGTIEAIIADDTFDNVQRTHSEILIPANSRQQALGTMLDMGQAMARSANALTEKVYFRIVGLCEVLVDGGED